MDGKSLAVELQSEVPSDGYEGFDRAFVNLAKSAASGSLRLDWHPAIAESDLKSSPMDPRSGYSQVIYPKLRSAIHARRAPHPVSKLHKQELVAAYLRNPKFAQRFHAIGAIGSGVISATSSQGLTAAALNVSEKFFDGVDVLYSIVLFDAESREVGRVFPGKMLCIDLAFSPNGQRLAAVMCTGKKRIKANSKKTVRAGEALLLWECDNVRGKPQKLPLERAAATPVTADLAKLLGRKVKRSIRWTSDTDVEVQPHDGKGALTWSV